MRNNQQLEKFLETLQIIDAHEHIPFKDEQCSGVYDFFDLLVPYVCDHLVSAGMSLEEWGQITNKSVNEGERFKKLEKYIPYIKFTTYWEALQKTVRKYFDEEEINAESVVAITKKLRNNEIPYCEIVKKNNIEKVLTFVGYDNVREWSEMITGVPTVSDVTPKSYDDLLRLESATGIKISNLQDFDKVVNELMRRYDEKGIRCLKFGSAYSRPLDFVDPDIEPAKVQLKSLLEKKNEFRCNGVILKTADSTMLKDLDNYISRCFFKEADKRGMTVIFHTGMFAWNNNRIDSSDPSHLLNVIRDFPGLKIVLLHCGMPFCDQAILLARYYPNVFLDLTWTHLLSKRKTKDLIEDILESVPLQKISAFGGDYCLPQQISGGLQICKENLCTVFSQRIEEGGMSLEDAKNILKSWLYDNPKKIYSI